MEVFVDKDDKAQPCPFGVSPLLSLLSLTKEDNGDVKQSLRVQLAPSTVSEAKEERGLPGQELSNCSAHFMAAGQSCGEEIVGATQGSKDSRRHLWT